MRLAILMAGLIVCMPALGVAAFLYDVPGAAVAALAAFGVIYTPFMVAAWYARTLQEHFVDSH
jgi:heme A synthase